MSSRDLGRQSTMTSPRTNERSHLTSLSGVTMLVS